MARKQQFFHASEGSTTRALYATPPAMHRVEFKFRDENGNELIVDMDHDKARIVIEQAIAAYSAIQAPLKVPHNIPWGG